MGYVGFSAKGGFTERFINLCTIKKIPLWNMKKVGDVFYAETTVEGYKSIRQSAYRSGVKMKLEGKHGLPFFLNSNRRRNGIVIGFAAAMLIVFLLSTMVWSISVEGNKELSEAEILTVFEQLGVRKGVFRKSIRSSDVAYEAEKQLPELLWASVNVKGSRVEIVVCERTDAPEFPDTETPCNIVADEDGVIVSVQANIGTEAVKPGDAVIKGDLLISGVTENLDGTQNLKSARGNVKASVVRNISSDCKDKAFFTQSQYKKRYSLYLLGIRIPFGFSVGESNYCYEESYLSNGKITLPVGIITEHSFTADCETALSDETLTLYNAQAYSEKYREICNEAEINSENFSFSDGAFFCEITAWKDIGVRQEIFIEK